MTDPRIQFSVQDIREVLQIDAEVSNKDILRTARVGCGASFFAPEEEIVTALSQKGLTMDDLAGIGFSLHSLGVHRQAGNDPVATDVNHRRFREYRDNLRTRLKDTRFDFGKAFARQVHQRLVNEFGLQPYAAVKVMKSAGPGRAIEAVRWLVDAATTLVIERGVSLGDAVDTLDSVLYGLGGRNSFGRIRQEGVLRSLGLPVPHGSGRYGPSARHLDAVLSGAAEALHGRLLDHLAEQLEERVETKTAESLFVY
ncbi:hypothetical protein IIA94_01425 [Patescibacteria group bacterium]|nr:hypothetical protein [Patescibacteria group bacterium]